MLALDLKDDARKLFEDVVARYPKTGAAQRAKARLTELSGPKRRTPPRKG
jgi:TolA-binding protein